MFIAASWERGSREMLVGKIDKITGHLTHLLEEQLGGVGCEIVFVDGQGRRIT